MCVFLYVTKWSSGLPKLKPKDSWGTMGTHTSSETEIQFILDILMTTSTTPLHRGSCFCLHRTLCSALLLSAHQVTSASWHFKVVFDPSKSLKIIFFRLALQCAAFKDKKLVYEWDQEQKVQFCDSSNGTPTFHTDYLPWISYLRQNFFFNKKKRPDVRSANMLCPNHPESLELWEVKKRQAVFPLSAFLINFDLSHFSIGCLHIHFIQERWRKFQRKSKKHKNDFLKKVQPPLERWNRTACSNRWLHL